jgi:ABC-type transport system involved in cytochrome c biogenesis permease subunit
MLRKILLTFAVILLFTAVGLGIFAHAIYTSNGQIDTTVVSFALGSIVSIVVAFVILRGTTRDKPVDLEKAFNANWQQAKLGAFFMAFGVIVLGLLTPMIYGAIETEIVRLGVKGMIDDFPAASVRPAMQWLYDGFGTLGVISPVLIFGMFLVVIGWRLFRPSRR